MVDIRPPEHCNERLRELRRMATVSLSDVRTQQGIENQAPATA